MKEEVLKTLRKFTRHREIKIMPRGNSAIFAALYCIKKASDNPMLLIPDQGGWISFRKYPDILNIDYRELTTDRGVVNLKELEKQLKIGASALMITSFAGYYAEQPLKKISSLCRKYNCLLIEDASGAVSDKKLCNGKYSDIIVGSFGRWKPIDLGYGGFISTNKVELFDKGKDIFSLFKVSNDIYDMLPPFLNNHRFKKIIKTASQIKKDLSDIDIFHRKLRGLNVVTEYNQRVLDYCANEGFQYVLCPSYIRVNEKAISVEVKRT
jgi:hypothetical protein